MSYSCVTGYTQRRNWLFGAAGDLELCGAVMQLVVGITVLVVVCLGVPTAAQKPCSLQLSDSVLWFGGKFYSQYIGATNMMSLCVECIKIYIWNNQQAASVSSHCSELTKCMNYLQLYGWISKHNWRFLVIFEIQFFPSYWIACAYISFNSIYMQYLP